MMACQSLAMLPSACCDHGHMAMAALPKILFEALTSDHVAVA
jgi:hypothetical protein